MKDLKSFYKGKIVLVTGGAGSIGSEIVRKLLELDVKTVRVLDVNETGLFDLQQELNSPKIRPLIGDVRDKERLRKAMEGIDIVFHAAALKHVPLCEYNPFEAVKTNVDGTQNLIDAATEEEVEKFITISTDKAVNPINVMGASKLLAERLTTAAHQSKGARKTAFSVVRFGNVLDSRGSILPIIKSQVERGGPVTITDERMTRFLMSIDDAVMLVLKATVLANGGEIFILKMPCVNIKDLIDAAVEELGKKVKIEKIGKRPGEKMHEELMTDTEMASMKEVDGLCIVYAEKDYKTDVKEGQVNKYNSRYAEHLSREEIRKIIRKVWS